MLIIAIALLKMVLSHEISGYMYSYYENSFISNYNGISQHQNEPLLFTLGVDLKKYKNNQISEFEVVRIGLKQTNKYKIEINGRGESKLKIHNKCEAMHNGRLIAGSCSRNPNQKFVWIPEHLFTNFVSRLRSRQYGKNKCNRQSQNLDLQPGNIGDEDRNYARTEDIAKEVKEEFNQLRNARKIIDKAKTMIKRSEKIKNSKKACEDLDGVGWCSKGKNGFGIINDRIFNNYIDYYCKINQESSGCKSRLSKTQKLLEKCIGGHKGHCKELRPKHKKSNLEQLRALAPPIFEDSFLKKLTNIVKAGGDCLNSITNRGYVSPKKRPRKRGIYAKGEDPEDKYSVLCECRFECVRNPKNGICYYKADANGKLMPIMQSKKCCKVEEEDICNLENKIEHHLCKLSVENDYGYFSQFIDETYACS